MGTDVSLAAGKAMGGTTGGRGGGGAQTCSFSPRTLIIRVPFPT